MPFIVRWPGQVPAGRVSEAIFATIVHRRSRALERVERISIIARNGEFSRTAYERMDPRVYTYRTRGQIMERICHILAGRVGEYIFYGEASTLSSGRGRSWASI